MKRRSVTADFKVFSDDPLERASLAIADIAQGHMVILVDDEDRENEGDLVIAAEKCTSDAINFMATEGRGLICLTLVSEQVERLGLPMMSTNNQSLYQTAFTVSIEAREGVSTGISTADRAHTVQVAIQPNATARDIVVPGHMFPLRARDGGVLERVGQTEGSVDLARLAGLNPAGVICEIMKADGTMARLPDLIAFGQRTGIRVVAVADLIKHRMQHERVVSRLSEGEMEVPGLGLWRTFLYRCHCTSGLHVAMVKGAPAADGALVRAQVAPPTWAAINPAINGASKSARVAMERINARGAGVLLLMHSNGGSNGTVEHAFAQDFGGHAPVEPPTSEAALRDLGAGCQILADLGLRDLQLLVGSSRTFAGLEAYGLKVIDLLPLYADESSS